jgi:PAS domain S-box-containing protein
MCYFDCGKLTITKVSKNFEAVTGYRADEAKGSPLGLILPEELKHRHDGLVQKWIDDGHSTD